MLHTITIERPPPASILKTDMQLRRVYVCTNHRGEREICVFISRMGNHYTFVNIRTLLTLTLDGAAKVKTTNLRVSEIKLQEATGT